MFRRIAIAAACLGLVLAAPASADLGISVSDGMPYAWSKSFTNLLGGAPMRWIRLFVPWNAVWQSNGQGCVANGNPAGNDLYNSLWTVERLHKRALLVISNAYWGAPSPSQADYQCGAQGIESAIANWHLGQWRMPVEAFNEPDFNAPNGAVPVGQAVNYFLSLLSAGWGNGWFRPVAGVFSNGYGANYPNSYAWQYVAELSSTWGSRWAGSWSWHDYGDVIHSLNCASYQLWECGRFEASQMLALLRGWREPLSDTWITESGAPKLFDPGLTRSQEAHAAYAWERLRGAGEDHLFWYQFQTFPGDAWDSALRDANGALDPSYCVIAFNELPWRALERCHG